MKVLVSLIDGLIVDPAVLRSFKFRVLRQNRRIVRDSARKVELDNFHAVLDDMGHGRATPRVRQFIIDAFVRGAESCKHTAASRAAASYGEGSDKKSLAAGTRLERAWLTRLECA